MIPNAIAESINVVLKNLMASYRTVLNEVIYFGFIVKQVILFLQKDNVSLRHCYLQLLRKHILILSLPNRCVVIPYGIAESINVVYKNLMASYRPGPSCSNDG